MRFGARRYGPLAPETFQFGKYDSFTSTGLPISETSNEIESTVVRTLLTCVGVTVRGCARFRSLASTRTQSFGPVCAYAVPSPSRFVHQGAVVHSQPSCIRGSAPDAASHVVPQHDEYDGRPPGSPVSTTGSWFMPTTRSL